MKNFSDLLATRPSIDLCLVLEPITNNGAPYCKVQVNQELMFSDDLVRPLCLKTTLDLTAPITVSITLQNKVYDVCKETAIVIKSFMIDQLELVPKWTHIASYHNDHGFDQASHYLGFNGTWQWTSQKPFYLWRHEATAQGWLLEPITATALHCVANSSSTKATTGHSVVENKISTMDPR